MFRAAAVFGSCAGRVTLQQFGSCAGRVTLQQFGQLLPNDSKAIYDVCRITGEWIQI